MAIKPSASINGYTEEQKKVLYDAIDAWHKKSAELAKCIADEKVLRQALCDTYFPTPREGTNKMLIGFGMELKMDFRINRKIDEVALDAAIAGKMINPDTITECIKYKPTLSATGWKALDDDDRKLFADIVTETPGTPGLELFKPKQ